MVEQLQGFKEQNWKIMTPVEFDNISNIINDLNGRVTQDTVGKFFTKKIPSLLSGEMFAPTEEDLALRAEQRRRLGLE